MMIKRNSSFFIHVLIITFASCSQVCLDDVDQNEIAIPAGVYKDTLLVAHWNLGHLSLGASANTSITSDKVSIRASEYHSLLDTLKYDFIGICEYEPLFSNSGVDTRNILFGSYMYSIVGPKYSYNCNAVFSTINLFSSSIIKFSSCVQNRYFLECSFYLNGKEVKFVETHLDWNEGRLGADCRNKQIASLSQYYATSPYVIICADFNISDVSEYSSFTNLGYDLANTGTNGTYYTYPAVDPVSAIDNIITKGFIIKDVNVVTDSKLSDHSLLQVLLIMK